jgi:hypothetical protein
MEREEVQSSAITSVGYDPLSEVLEIEFASGAIWQYLGVPEAEHRELLSGSVGKYFHSQIKDKYPENRVR